ncbi:single-stranded DNA-binding protein [Deinococcus sp. MIMF12]|uniref:Single-stranded DNA-binding protein n=1 Tax=Deinococcus rhizophilus TaxID=3049544 RepID=A0ABT7JEF4_9DEIO|nr:single-stranded DNA-binding protein [Deinococcus rhizophilus]MDL2342858.1 single-stranded DNA-binding protein [Deinococcus rhizophilus]
MNRNLVLLIGALARTPELRYTPSGTAVLDMTIAGERSVIGADGKSHTIPFYENVQALGKVAEAIVARGYEQGTALMVEGQLDYSTWSTPEGEKRSMLRTKVTGSVRQIAGEPSLVTDAGGNVRLAGGMSQVEFTGNLSADVEVRYTPAGDAVADLRMAVNERYRDRQNQPQEKTHWVTVTVWREQAEAVANLRKGDAVFVQGALIDESWSDRDGNKRRQKKVEASLVVALARSATSGEGNARTPARAAQPQRERAAATAAPAARSGGLDIDQGVDDFPAEEADLPF